MIFGRVQQKVVYKEIIHFHVLEYCIQTALHSDCDSRNPLLTFICMSRFLKQIPAQMTLPDLTDSNLE